MNNDTYKLFNVTISQTTYDDKIKFIESQIAKYRGCVEVDHSISIDKNKLYQALTSDFVSYFIPEITDETRPMKVEIEIRKFGFWCKS